MNTVTFQGKQVLKFFTRKALGNLWHQNNKLRDIRSQDLVVSCSITMDCYTTFLGTLNSVYYLR